MKVTDLMIGDLVQFDEDTCVIDELRVDGMAVLVAMNTDLTSVDGDQVDVEELSPIELTEEILVKNGWRKQTMPYKDEWYGGISLFEEHGKFYYMDFKIEYVHQLQQLLRLAGVEKTIEL